MGLIRSALRIFLALFAVYLVVAVFRMGTPATAFRRTIVVDVPRDVAWDHFSRPREWKSWLGEQAPTDVRPTEVVGSETVASPGGLAFRMAEFAPPDHWMWAAEVLWFRLEYDHIFERLTDRQTRMVFEMEVSGFGADLFGWFIGAASAAAGQPESLRRLEAEINARPDAKGK